jgi:hypothetical protein
LQVRCCHLSQESHWRASYLARTGDSHTTQGYTDDILNTYQLRIFYLIYPSCYYKQQEIMFVQEKERLVWFVFDFKTTKLRNLYGFVWKKFITKDINLWLTRIAGTMLSSVTGITLESLLLSTNRRLTHDTRIHRQYSEYIPTANFLFIIFIQSHTNFSITFLNHFFYPMIPCWFNS